MEERTPLHYVLLLCLHLFECLVVQHYLQNVECLGSEIAIRLQLVVFPVPVEEPGDFFVYVRRDIFHQFAEDGFHSFADALALAVDQLIFEGRDVRGELDICKARHQYWEVAVKVMVTVLPGWSLIMQFIYSEVVRRVGLV